MSTRAERIGGDFRYEHPIEIRFADTDAFGHVNNAAYLTFFEAARAGYYAAVTGTPFMTGAHGSAHNFVVAEARVAYRAPARFGEPLLVGCRFAWTSRTSFGLEYRIRAEQSAVGTARTVADGETVQVMFDLASNRVARVPADLVDLFESYQGAPIRRR